MRISNLCLTTGFFVLVTWWSGVSSLPIGDRTESAEAEDKSQRRNNKALRFFGYMPPGGQVNNQLARTDPQKLSSYPNSPIYYIRLPPSPYVFVPGLGYVSPPQNPSFGYNPFINVPIEFLSNGKPTSVYEWGPQTSPVPIIPAPTPSTTTTTTTTPRPYRPAHTKPDSTIHNIKGSYLFNGKPSSIFIMRNPYSTLLNDALQSFYP